MGGAELEPAKQIMGIGHRIAAFCFLTALTLTIPEAARPAQDERPEDPLIEFARQPWTGDLDGMIERGFIRVLTTYNPIFFSFDGIEQRGLLVEGVACNAGCCRPL